MRMTFQSARTGPKPLDVTVNVADPVKPFGWSITTWPRRERPREVDGDAVTATENLWDPATERLAYAAGQPVPADEAERLITETELHARHTRGEHA